MFEIIFSCVILISISLIVIFSIIIHDVKNNEYEIKEKSEIGKEAEEKYLKEFPNYTIFSLKSEIEKIADILVDNQSSNRYTELLREKASKDEKVQKLKNAVMEDIDILKYNKGNLRAKIKYRDYDYNYSMVFNLSTVARGRVFLNNYLVYKEKIAV